MANPPPPPPDKAHTKSSLSAKGRAGDPPPRVHHTMPGMGTGNGIGDALMVVSIVAPFVVLVWLLVNQ